MLYELITLTRAVYHQQSHDTIGIPIHITIQDCTEFHLSKTLHTIGPLLTIGRAGS